MSATPVAFPPTIALDEQRRLVQDIACLGCGYNLRGLSLDGACPECGTAIGRSVQGDFLRFRNPVWVKRLATGMNWIVASIVASFGVNCISRNMPSELRELALMLALVPQALSVIGYWMVTMPEPGRVQETLGGKSRLIARWGTVAAGAVDVAMIAVIQFDRMAALALSLVAATIGLVASVAVAVYARQIALRIPDLTLARNTRTVMWGYFVCFGVAILGGVLAIWMKSSGPSNAGLPDLNLIMVPLCLGGVGLIVFGIWSLVIIVQYRNRLHKAAAEALSTWASQPVSAPPAAIPS